MTDGAVGRAARRAAEAVAERHRRQHGQMARQVELAVVRRAASPIRVELVESNLLLEEGDDVRLTGTLRAWDATHRLKVGDMLCVVALADHTYLAFDLANSEQAVDPWNTVPDGSVTTAKIAAGAVTIPKLSFDPATQAELDAHAALTTSAHGGVVASTDARLSDARTPTAHAATHVPGGSDRVDAVGVSDTRTTEEAPMSSAPYRTSFRSEFKQRASISGNPGTGLYGVLTTYAGWTDDSGGGTKQTWLDDSSPPRLFVRRGTIAGGWSAWSEVAQLAGPALTGTPTAPTPSAGDSSTKLATTAFVAAATAANLGLTPVGTVVPYAGAGDPSTSWLLCDGREVSRTTYAALFAALGGASSPYGLGNGSTTFNLPDYRGRVPVGADNMGTAAGAASRLTASGTRGAVGGEEKHQLNTTELASHTHVQNAHAHGPSNASVQFAYTSAIGQVAGGAAFGAINDFSSTTANATAVNQNAGGDTPHNNMQPFQVANYIIRVL